MFLQLCFLKAMKKELRKQMLVLRSIQKEELGQSASRCIFEKLKENPFFQSGESFMIYISYNGEVDTKPVIEYLLSINKSVYVPKITGEGIMEAVKITSLDFEKDFLKNSYGIYEPINTCEKSNAENIDFAVIPMVAGDLENNRLGYGGGYYDRFFEKSKAYKCGVCYDFQLLKDAYIPAEDNDVKMDVIITENTTVKTV